MNNWFDFLKQYEDIKELKTISKDLIFISDIKPDNKVLDIGTGTGRIAFEAYKNIGEKGYVTGIDFEQENIDFCNRKCKENNFCDNINFLNADLNNRLPFPDEHFDIIYSRSVLMHIENKKHVLQELYRVLKPNGKIILHEVMHYDKLFRIYDFLDKNAKNYHKYKEIEELVRNDIDDPITNFDFSSLKKLLKSCGFKKVFSNLQKHFDSFFISRDDSDYWSYIFYDKSNMMPRKYTLKDKFLKYMTKEEYSDYEKSVNNQMIKKFIIRPAFSSNIFVAKSISFIDYLKILSRFLFVYLKNFQYVKNCEFIQKLYLRIEMAKSYIKFIIKENAISFETTKTLLKILFR